MSKLGRSGRRLARILHRGGQSLSTRDVVGSLRRILAKLRGPSAQERLVRAAAQAADLEFDTTHNVETASMVDPATLAIPSQNWIYSSLYYPIRPADFRKALETAPIEYPAYTFIDIGAGKGRAMLLASEYPFAKIIGVEFSPELMQVLHANLRTYRSATQQCTNFEALCMDAVEFPIPPVPSVVFFYDPFEVRILVQVVENIRRSLESHPRDLIVIYDSPQRQHDLALKTIPSLSRVIGRGGYSVYKTTLRQASNATRTASRTGIDISTGAMP